jgi:hypothetical protein
MQNWCTRIFGCIGGKQNLFVVQRLLMEPVSIPWVKDEHVWNSGGIIIDRRMNK